MWKRFNNVLVFGALLGLLAVTGPASKTALAQVEGVSQEVLIHYSLAAESYKNQQYEDARPHLRWLMNNAASAYNGRRVFDRAYNTYAELAKVAPDSETKAALLDTCLQVLETAPDSLRGTSGFNEADWLVRYGDYLRDNEAMFSEHGVDVEERSTELYREAFELAPQDIDTYYVRLVAMHYSSTGRKDEAVAFMDLAEAEYAGDPTTIDYFDTIRNSLFKSPAERMAFLEGQLEKDPENLELVSELFDIYRNVEDTDKMEEIGARLLEMDPTARVFRLLAEVQYNQGNYEQALELNNKALEIAESDDERRDIHYNLGLSLYELGRLPQARREAERALRIDPSFGVAELLIGDVYVRAVEGSNFERTDKAVYWLAADHYRQAIQRNPDLRNQANQKINQYRRFFPDQEEKFFEGWTSGQEYRIDYDRYSWISRTTTVR